MHRNIRSPGVATVQTLSFMQKCHLRGAPVFGGRIIVEQNLHHTGGPCNLGIRCPTVEACRCKGGSVSGAHLCRALVCCHTACRSCLSVPAVTPWRTSLISCPHSQTCVSRTCWVAMVICGRKLECGVLEPAVPVGPRMVCMVQSGPRCLPKDLSELKPAKTSEIWWRVSKKRSSAHGVMIDIICATQ